MKKLFLLAAALIMLSLPAMNAQTTPANPKATTVKTKKDGTPDKRFKENKGTTTTAKPAGPTKKDGTPDMRYKANKSAAKKK